MLQHLDESWRHIRSSEMSLRVGVSKASEKQEVLIISTQHVQHIPSLPSPHLLCQYPRRCHEVKGDISAFSGILSVMTSEHCVSDIASAACLPLCG